MTGNHWTIFNGAGAVVADNMSLDAVSAYLTPERFARGWNAAFVLLVNSQEHLEALEAESRNFPAEAP